jgi:phosphoribosylaminoimidazole (AIR) synthetase
MYDTTKPDAEEIYRTLNCEVGFVLSANQDNLEKIITSFNHSDFMADVFGRITNGNVRIKSSFSNREIVL